MMGRWLARLKSEKSPDTYATKPTKPPEGVEKVGFVGFVASSRATISKNERGGDPGFVGFVASPAAPFQKIEGEGRSSKAGAEAVNDAAPAADPDRWCWLHSPAMNSREIDTFTARLARFTDKGVKLEDGERLADKLVIRDREGDDRRLCLECAHLHGAGRWRCGNWRAADVAAQGLARDLALTLQRCAAFGRS
jgi:hypothetical protein